MRKEKIRNWLRISASMMAISVVLGAFGAHGLKPKLSEYQLEIFQKGIFYLMIHTLGMLVANALGWIDVLKPQRVKWINVSFLLGCIFFSGSLFLLATRDIFINLPDAFGLVTPIGGLCFITGWVLLSTSIKKS